MLVRIYLFDRKRKQGYCGWHDANWSCGLTIFVNATITFSMKIDIVHQQKTKNSATVDLIKRKIRLTLGRFTTAIQGVRVAVVQDEKNKGARGVQCVVEITLTPSQQIMVQGQGGDVSSALDTCLPRAARTVARNLERLRKAS
jgi:hypothetical protein